MTLRWSHVSAGQWLCTYFSVLTLDFMDRPLSWATSWLKDYTETGQEKHIYNLRWTVRQIQAPFLKRRTKINPIIHQTSILLQLPIPQVLLQEQYLNDILHSHMIFKLKCGRNSLVPDFLIIVTSQILHSNYNVASVNCCLSWWSQFKLLFVRIKLVTLLSCDRQSGAT